MTFRNLTILLVLILTAACGRPEFGTTSSADENVVESDTERETPNQGSEGPAAGDDASFDSDGDAAEEQANNASPTLDENGGSRAVEVEDFAFTAFSAAGADGRDAVVAPHGLARSLVITHAAVAPEEGDAIAALLEPYLDYQPLYEGFNSADLELESREEGGGFSMLGAVWAQEDVAVEQDFIDTLARYLGLELRLVDFETSPEDARATINNWYRDETMGRLSEVVGPRGVDGETRFTITDATWFSQPWAFGGFDPTLTEYRTFYGTESDVQLPMMYANDTFFHVAGSDFQAVILPFEGDFSMIAVLPDDLETFESNLDGDFVERLVNESEPASVGLRFPRVEISDRVRLSSVAADLGIDGLFAADTDYTAFADATSLDDAHQRTRITFSEEGVDAMAVSDDGQSVGDPAPPESGAVELTFDRPFFFAIRDSQTGTLLFLGRLAQP